MRGCVCMCVSLCASVCAIYVLFKIIFIEKILENFICKMQQKFNLVYLFHDSCHLTVQNFHNGVRKTFWVTLFLSWCDEFDKINAD